MEFLIGFVILAFLFYAVRISVRRFQIWKRAELAKRFWDEDNVDNIASGHE